MARVSDQVLDLAAQAVAITSPVRPTAFATKVGAAFRGGTAGGTVRVILLAGPTATDNDLVEVDSADVSGAAPRAVDLISTAPYPFHAVRIEPTGGATITGKAYIVTE